MRLLVITQVMDRKDSSLGFFVRWVEEIAKRIDTTQVICLKKGEYNPFTSDDAQFRRNPIVLDSVRVHSLGKEEAMSSECEWMQRARYAYRFYRLLLRLHGTYDAVFVHMNQEYILLAGPFWRLFGIPVFLWRNHYQGSLKTNIAVALASKVFCTSRYSYTAQFKKTTLMPVGVDIDSLNTDTPIERKSRSILFLARFDRSKKPHLLVQALAELKKQGVSFTATFVGGPSDQSSTYVDEVKDLARTLGVLDDCTFVGAVPNTETFRFYRSHDIYVNCAGSGMLDKTIFEAAAAGCLVATSSLDIAAYLDTTIIFKEDSKDDLARVLINFLTASPLMRADWGSRLSTIVSRNKLTTLADELIAQISSV